MVLTTTSTDSEPKERPNITPFQNWFNKNQKRLEEEFDSDFMEWCNDKYNEKGLEKKL